MVMDEQSANMDPESHFNITASGIHIWWVGEGGGSENVFGCERYTK